MLSLCVRFHGDDLIDDVHPLNDLAKNSVTGARARFVESRVILDIDEELRCGRVRIVRAMAVFSGG